MEKLPHSMTPGHFTISGTRKPPSQLSFFSPRNGIVPPSGQVSSVSLPWAEPPQHCGDEEQRYSLDERHEQPFLNRCDHDHHRAVCCVRPDRGRLFSTRPRRGDSVRSPDRITVV